MPEWVQQMEVLRQVGYTVRVVFQASGEPWLWDPGHPDRPFVKDYRPVCVRLYWGLRDGRWRRNEEVLGEDVPDAMRKVLAAAARMATYYGRNYGHRPRPVEWQQVVTDL